MLEPSVWLLHQTQAPHIRRLLRSHAARVAGCDVVDYDVVRGTVVYSADGRPVVRYRVEVLGVFRPAARLFRWGWVGRSKAENGGRVDAIQRDGEKLRLAQLMAGGLPDISENDVERLVHLGAHLAGAVGIYRHVVRLGHEGHRFHYLALFDAESLSMSMSMSESTRPPPVVQPAPIQTMPPAAPDGSTRLALAREVRSPRESLLHEVAAAALPLLRRTLPGFHEALFVIRVDLRQNKARFFATLSVVDARGQLQMVEATTSLMGAAARLIGDDHNDGNGRWERLVIRLAGDDADAAVVKAEAA